MGVVIRVNGNDSGEGFLIAPAGGRSFPVPIVLSSDDGASLKVTLSLTGRRELAKLSQTEVQLCSDPVELTIEATDASDARGDIDLTVSSENGIEASFNLTSIANPKLNYNGRFQARFATDGDFYYEQRGTRRGWNFALEGEPDFCPPLPDSIADSIDKPVGRVVRFNDAPVAREFVPPIGVTVSNVEGQVGGQAVQFTAGDPVIGRPVNLGPHSYLASNSPFAPNARPAETHNPGAEPIAIFELHVGDHLSGTSAAPEDRPFADGFFPLSDQQLAQLGLPPLAAFNANRKQTLTDAYTALSSADRTGTVEGRNLATRIGHLGGDPSLGIPRLQSTLTVGYGGFERYTGKVDKDLQIDSSASSVLDYFSGFNSLDFEALFYGYHSDEQCGHVLGSVAASS